MKFLRIILPKSLKNFLKIVRYLPQSYFYPVAQNLNFPLRDWEVNDVKFLEHQEYGGEDWGEHLGEDCVTEPGTSVYAIGRGTVVYSDLHSPEKEPEQEGKGSNWGNVVIIAHRNYFSERIFFSVYGHLQNVRFQEGDLVPGGRKIAEVAPSWSRANGYWRKAHLHLGIYTGFWKGEVLPGKFKQEEERTKKKDWKAPTQFINEYKTQE